MRYFCSVIDQSMKTIVFLFLGLVSFTHIYTQDLSPVKWSFEAESLGEDQYKIKFLATIDKGWAIYGQESSDYGPIPTSFTFDENENIEFIDGVKEPEDKISGHDEMFDMVVTKFKGQPEFYQIVKCKTKGEKLKGYLTFMCCDDSKCLPPEDVEFELNLD